MDRRTFLTSTGSATGLAVLTSLPAAGYQYKRPRTRFPLPEVQPVHANQLAQGYGVCSHPNFNKATYQHTAAWMERLAGMNASYFRGRYAQQLPSVRLATSEARKHGLGWLATVTPENLQQTESELLARLSHLRDNAADVVIAVEGVNESNQSSTGTRPVDWAERTVEVQKTIWDFVKATPALNHVRVVGPSLHATVDTAHEDHLQLGSLGLQRYFDYAGLHRYFGGRYPNYLIDERLGWIREAYGDVPTWVTETGYTNSVANLTEHKPVPENISAAYGPICLLEFAVRGCRSTRYELLDDPDAGAKDEVESNLGLWRTPSLDPSTWTEKPEADRMRMFLASLQDPGAAYTPDPIRLKIEAPEEVRSLVVSKRNGNAALLLWQARGIFDPIKQQPVSVPSVNVQVKTPQSWNIVSVPAGEVVTFRL
ncbi:MAG: hypothetical protein H0T14_02850 [Nocardioidaceae bacterium]|jgi:hypothetical protein|nr:hypothetical protein [Nocardioidaceae bacterium]